MMRRVHEALARSIAIATASLAAIACGSPPMPVAAQSDVAEPQTAETKPLFGPARYVLTESLGVLYDEASSPTESPRSEPAIVEGARVLLDHGLVVASRSDDEHLRGFGSIPSRLGGGFLFWSYERTFRADDFLGDLEPLADVAATGGVRPWLTTVWLRTDRGVIALDPSSRACREEPVLGLADGLALDPLRGVRVDTFGRASFTIDGGATFVDVLATRGFVTSALRRADGAIHLVGRSGRAELALGESGGLVAAGPSRASQEDPLLPAVPFGLPPIAERTAEA